MDVVGGRTKMNEKIVYASWFANDDTHIADVKVAIYSPEHEVKPGDYLIITQTNIEKNMVKICPMTSLHDFKDLKPQTKCSLCGVSVAEVMPRHIPILI
jgi:hypothetical protein